MVKRFLIFLVLVVLVCGGLVGFNIFRSKMIGEFFANRQAPAVTISATEVTATRWSPQIEAIGTLLAAEGVDVASEAAGNVESIHFKANETVQKGQLLVKLDDAVERADLAAAETRLANDTAQLQRAETLQSRGVNSEAALEEAQTSVAAARSILERTRAMIEQKSIKAPFAGEIGIPRIDVGKYLQPGTMIATLQQLGTMRADFTVPEQQLGDVRIGQPASFGLTENNFPYRGRITGIDPKVDPQTRLVAVRADVDNPDGELRPGQFVRVRVDLPPVDNVIALPQTSVVTSLYGDYVYVVEKADQQPGTPAPAGKAPEAPSDGAAAAAAPAGDELIARQVFVEIGRRQGNLIEVSKGLEPGQMVVTSGQNKLSNNVPVVINNSVDPAAIAFGEKDERS